MAEFNRRMQKGAVEFAKLQPQAEVVLMRMCMKPALEHSMAQLLDMASADWRRRNDAAAAIGQPVRYPMLECARGVVTRGFFESVESLLFDEAWEVIPLAKRTSNLVVTAFKLLSRAACSMTALVAEKHAAYPFRLFLLLSDDEDVRRQVLNDPHCMFDEFTHDLHTKFPSEAELLSAECRAVLMACLSLIHVETVDVEARHASLRRCCVKSQQTWKRTVRQVVGDFFLLTQRRCQMGPWPAPEPLPRKSAVGRKRKRKQKPTRQLSTKNRKSTGDSDGLTTIFSWGGWDARQDGCCSRQTT
jgi:hypothetical protein